MLIAMANKNVILASAAAKFPMLDVNYSDGSSLKLPITSVGNYANTPKLNVPKASLLCFITPCQLTAYVDSWSPPFLDTFGHSGDVQLNKISFIDSWLLSHNPIKKLLLKIMRKPKPGGTKDVMQRQRLFHLVMTISSGKSLEF